MSHLIYLESTCDKCGAQAREKYAGAQDAPLPRGWTNLKLGIAATRHLCERCNRELREWLGFGSEVP
jgi:hypothetical protein